MNEAIQQIITQAMAYGVVILAFFMLMAFLMRGFLFKFLSVRTSGGTKILVKCKEVDRDTFTVGKIQEGFLKFKYNKGEKTMALPVNVPTIYRSMTISWVDIDAINWSFISRGGSQVSGFDPEKFTSLNQRALYKPAILGDQNKILILLLIIIIVAVVGSIIFMYQMNKNLSTLGPQIDAIAQICKSTTKAILK